MDTESLDSLLYSFNSAFKTSIGNNYAIFCDPGFTSYVPIVIHDWQMSILFSYSQKQDPEACGLYSSLFTLMMICGVGIQSLEVHYDNNSPSKIADCTMTFHDTAMDGGMSQMGYTLADGAILSVLTGLPFIINTAYNKLILPVNHDKMDGGGLSGLILKEIEECEKYINLNP